MRPRALYDPERDKRLGRLEELVIAIIAQEHGVEFAERQRLWLYGAES